MVYDAAVIGAGVVGAFIARELSRYNLKVCLLEKEADVAMGTTKANSAIVHAGYDAKHGTLKGILNVRGNELMEQAAKELRAPFKRIGSLVLAFNDGDLASIEQLYHNGIKNKVPGLKLLNAEDTAAMEPNISDEVIGALYAPTAGIVCPYELTIGAVENAVENGVDLKLECGVLEIRKEREGFTLVTEQGEIQAAYVINASGLYGDLVSEMVQEKTFEIRPRKGEYLLLDKSQGNMVNTVIFQPPTAMGKGILVTPTVDGNLLTGPTALDILERDDVSTSAPGMRQVIEGARKSVPDIRFSDVITSFAGLRATPTTGDFVIEASKTAKGFINAVGIESPGLTAAPAIGEYVISILKKEGLSLVPREDFNPLRKPVIRFRELEDAEKQVLIRENPLYGNVICRCETITEGEIVDSIRRPAGARNLDAVKRRTRAGMGRCQGGFCTPRIVSILARELQTPAEEVTKKGKGSNILVGKRV
jgi:glycerol-3-phosphate dehydrogenase